MSWAIWVSTTASATQRGIRSVSESCSMLATVGAHLCQGQPALDMADMGGGDRVGSLASWLCSMFSTEDPDTQWKCPHSSNLYRAYPKRMASPPKKFGHIDDFQFCSPRGLPLTWSVKSKAILAASPRILFGVSDVKARSLGRAQGSLMSCYLTDS